MINQRILTYLGLAVLVTTTACKTSQATQKKVSVVPAIDSAAVVNANSVVAQNEKFAYHPARTRKYDIVHTKIALKFDYANRHAIGQANLIITPYFHPINELELDAKAFDLHQIALISKSGQPVGLKYKYDQEHINIALDRTYTTKDTFELLIAYTAKPYERTTSGGVAITSDRGLYFINHDNSEPNKPQQIWTQGETTFNSCWFPTFDSPNEKCTEELYLTVPNEYKTIANGRKVSSTINLDNTRTDYWKQDLPHSPYLFAFAVGDFGEYKDTWRGKEVNYYLEPKYAPYAKDIFGNTPEMLEFFSTKLGVDYPWDKYSQVVVREFVSGAMENTSCTIFFDKMNEDKNQLLDEDHEDIIAHELFHHWFGDLVTCESYGNLTLNEGFASYSEYLWFEHKYGKDDADYHIALDLSSYLGEANYKKEAIVRYNYANADDLFDRHSYQKGACVLHALRKYVGDEAFFAALHYYLKQHAYQNVELADLRIAFEKITGEDLNWFFNQWFLSPGHPEIMYSYQADSEQITFNISQYQVANPVPVFRLYFNTIIQDANGTERVIPIEISTVDTTFSLPNIGKVMNVILDGDASLVGTIQRKNNEVEMLHQLKYAKHFRHRLDAIQHLGEIPEKSDDVIDALKAATQDKFWLIRRIALEGLASYNGIRKKELLKEALKLAVTDPKSAVRATGLTEFREVKNLELIKAKKLEPLMDSVLRGALTDSSYMVQMEALIVANQWNSALAEEAADKYASSKNETLKLAAIRVFQNSVGEKNVGKIFDIIEKLEGANEKYFAIHSLLPKYLASLSEENKVKGIRMLLKIAESDKDWWVRFNAAEILGDYTERFEVKNYINNVLVKETKPELKELYNEVKKKLQ